MWDHFLYEEQLALNEARQEKDAIGKHSQEHALALLCSIVSCTLRFIKSPEFIGFIILDS